MNDKKYLVDSNRQYVIIACDGDDLHSVIDLLCMYLPDEYIHPEIFSREDTPVCISINTSKHYLVNYNTTLSYYTEKFSGISVEEFSDRTDFNQIFRPKSETQKVVEKAVNIRVESRKESPDTAETMIKALGTAEKTIKKQIQTEPHKYDKPMELISDLIDNNVELLNYEEEPIVPTIVEEPVVIVNTMSLLHTVDISYEYDAGNIIDSAFITITLKLSEDTIEYMKESKRAKSRKFCIEFVLCTEHISGSEGINKSCFFISNTKCLKSNVSMICTYDKENDNYTLRIPLVSLAYKLHIIESLVGIHTLTKNKFNNSVLTSSTKPFRINLTVNNNPDHPYKLYTLTEVKGGSPSYNYFGYYCRYSGGNASYPNTILSTGRSHYKPYQGSIELIAHCPWRSRLQHVIYCGSHRNTDAKWVIRNKYMNVTVNDTDTENIAVLYVNTDKFFKAFMSNIFVYGIGYVFSTRLDVTKVTGTMSLGSFLSDICSDTSGVEAFINTIKAEKLKDMYEIKCTTDEGSPKISELYSEAYHVTHTKGDLHNSCMRHSNCTTRLKLYDYLQEAGVLRMMYYKQMTSDKIFGRCLVWSYEGNEYYDRFYTAASFIRTKHIEKKIHNNFYYKKGNSPFPHFTLVIADEAIYDKAIVLLSTSIRDSLVSNNSYTLETKSTSQNIPYMDTATHIKFNHESKTITITF